VPFALGGAPTADNIQLRCRAHNGYEARVDFGERKVSVAGRRSAAGMRSEGLADSEVEAAGVGARVNSSRDELEQGGPVTAERGERSVEGPC